jgi:excisionase family DNA binding protein
VELLPEPEWDDAEGVAAWLGLTKRALYQRVEAGTLPVVRDGKRLLFHRPSIRRALGVEEPPNK